jgi:CRP-like cAMP-binding protein
MMEQGRVGTEIFIVIEGMDIVAEYDGEPNAKRQLGTGMVTRKDAKFKDTYGTGDFFGEQAVLFKPGTFSDASGTPIDGHRRAFTVYARNEEVIIGELSYETIQALRRERPEISNTLVPYANELAESLRQAGGDQDTLTQSATPVASALDCHPELELLESRMAAQMAKMDEQMARIEALLTRN